MVIMELFFWCSGDLIFDFIGYVMILFNDVFIVVNGVYFKKKFDVKVWIFICYFMI